MDSIMPPEGEQSDEQPTHEQTVEERFVADLAEAIWMWRAAGKPHKR